MVFLKFFIVAVLLSIAWQDFRYRAVYWWVFALLILGLGLAQGLLIGTALVSKYFLINSSFLMVQIGCVSVYFSIKERRFVNLFNGYFGLGDLFFLIAITVFFSMLNYIFFYVTSLVMVIMASAIFRRKETKIPLAGYQAIVFLLFMLMAEVLVLDWASDIWLSKYLNL